jgi:hypothetical protein
MNDGRTFDRGGLIFPGWVLEVRCRARLLKNMTATAGACAAGDTLCGIATRLLGSEACTPSCSSLMGTSGQGWTELRSPDLIWRTFACNPG